MLTMLEFSTFISQRRSKEPAPVVVLVTGYPDSGFEERVGMKQMQVQAYKDWAKLLAASGMAAVIYSNVEPVEDVFTLLRFPALRGGSAAD